MLRQIIISLAVIVAIANAMDAKAKLEAKMESETKLDSMQASIVQRDLMARDSGFVECNGRAKVIKLAPGDSVTVVSKNYPEEYENSDLCGWHFKTIPENGEIIFMCDVISLGWRDYLQLYQNPGSKKSYLVARSRMHYWDYLNVEFSSNFISAGTGFKCTASTPAPRTTKAPETTAAPETTVAVTDAAEETAQDNEKVSHCPSEYPTIHLASGSSMTVLSPNYPGQYPGNVRCGWNFQTDEGTTLEVACANFSLSNKDQMMLAHGPRANKHKYHFDNAPHNEQFTKGRLMMRFRSSPYTPGDGFNCTVSAL